MCVFHEGTTTPVKLVSLDIGARCDFWLGICAPRLFPLWCVSLPRGQVQHCYRREVDRSLETTRGMGNVAGGIGDLARRFVPSTETYFGS